MDVRTICLGILSRGDATGYEIKKLSDDAPSPFYVTFVRPDEERPYAKVLFVAMDMRQLDLDMEAGTEDPKPLTGPPGTGRVPRDPAIYTRIAAAFTATVYGIGMANLIFLPIANKLDVAVQAHTHLYEMQIEGLIALAQGENPRVIEGRLLGFLN